MGSTPRIFPNDAATSYEGFFLQLATGYPVACDPVLIFAPSRASNQKHPKTGGVYSIVMEESQVTLDCMGQVSELSNPRQLQMSLFDLTLAGAGQLLQETQDEGLEEVDLI